MNASDFYAMQAKALVKDLRERRGLPYKELARRLEAEGETVDVQVLINRVNKGKYSFGFALQLLAAMDAQSIPVPKNPGAAPRKRT